MRSTVRHEAGGIVARAKRTQRAEARRRYRVATTTDPATDAFEDEEPEARSTGARGDAPAKPTATTVRMGFVDAIKKSIHPIHVRDDFSALPAIAVHSPALWAPLLITIASTAAVIVTAGGTISQFLFAYFIQTPAIGGVFLAGFLAPRASWLLGVIVGLVSAACYAFIVFFYPLTIAATLPPTSDQARDVAISAFILSPIVGGFFAAGAAWYRRFLALTNPNRGRRGTQTPKQRPGDGRTRGGPASQKAGAKR
jgi:hypothetical protein